MGKKVGKLELNDSKTKQKKKIAQKRLCSRKYMTHTTLSTSCDFIFTKNVCQLLSQNSFSISSYMLHIDAN